MRSGLPRLSSLLLVTSALACGPGSDTTDATGSTTDATATGVTDGTTSTPVTTGEPTTTGSTADDTSTSSSTTATTTTDPTGGLACGDTLPPEGSPCPDEGETCAPDADPCDPYTEAICQGGVWVHGEVGPGDPSMCTDACDPFPTEGEPCNTEGSSCNTGCENQCEFCNVVQCTGGVWEGLEVFPAPCLDCPGICEFTVQPMCDGGPPDLDTCVAGCMDAMAGRCEIPFADMLACAGQMPTFTCDAADRPLVEGCEPAFDALYMCLGI